MKHKKIILPLIVLVGMIIFITIPFSENNIQNDNQMKVNCVQTFDNIIVPILTGQLKPSQITSNHWEEFILEKCASNHLQWEKYSIHSDSQINWKRLIEEEGKK